MDVVGDSSVVAVATAVAVVVATEDSDRTKSYRTLVRPLILVMRQSLWAALRLGSHDTSSC